MQGIWKWPFIETGTKTYFKKRYKWYTVYLAWSLFIAMQWVSAPTKFEVTYNPTVLLLSLDWIALLSRDLEKFGVEEEMISREFTV